MFTPASIHDTIDAVFIRRRTRDAGVIWFYPTPSKGGFPPRYLFFFNIERLHVLNQTKFPRNFVLCEMDLNFTKNTRAVNHFIQLHFDLHVMLRSEQYIFPSLICLSIVLMFNLNLLNCNKFI